MTLLHSIFYTLLQALRVVAILLPPMSVLSESCFMASSEPAAPLSVLSRRNRRRAIAMISVLCSRQRRLAARYARGSPKVGVGEAVGTGKVASLPGEVVNFCLQSLGLAECLRG